MPWHGTSFGDYFFSFKFIKRFCPPAQMAYDDQLKANLSSSIKPRHQQQIFNANGDVGKKSSNYWEFCTYSGFLSCLSLLFRWHFASEPCAAVSLEQNLRHPNSLFSAAGTQAAYSELNYHHRNDYRDYQIKFSSCGFRWRRRKKLRGET